MKKGLFAVLVIACLILVRNSFALITITPPGFGNDVVVRGTGAPAKGAVELYINGISQRSTIADDAGNWMIGHLNLVAGDDVQAYAS